MLGRLRRKVQPKTPSVTWAWKVLRARCFRARDLERKGGALSIVLVTGPSENNHTASTGNLERELSCS
jgi:hypothetical protein